MLKEEAAFLVFERRGGFVIGWKSLARQKDGVLQISTKGGEPIYVINPKSKVYATRALAEAQAKRTEGSYS